MKDDTHTSDMESGSEPGTNEQPDAQRDVRARRLSGGLTARVVQHEIDHLNGVLIIDHGPVVERHTAERGDA